MEGEGPLQVEHLLLSEETEVMALENRAGAVKVVGFDDEDSAVVGDEPGTVIEIDVVGREEFRDRLQSAGFVFHLDAQDLQKRDHEALFFEALNCLLAFINEKLHDAKAAAAGDGNPSEINARASDDRGDAGGLAGFIFDKDRDEIECAHIGADVSERTFVDDAFGFAFGNRD